MNDDNGPWNFISAYLIGNFIAGVLIRHWRFLAAIILVFVVYQYMVMAYHYLARVL
jgi:hypothetical protein